MKKAFNNVINSMICSYVIACIFGLILAISPNMSIQTISMIAAIFIIIYGIVLIALDIKISKFFVPFDGVLTGLLSIVLGIILLGRPDILSTIFTIAIGVWIILTSINLIKLSFSIMGVDNKAIWLLILGILDLIAGILVIFNPFEASISITVFAGIMIMAHAIINLVDLLIVKKDVKNFEKAITEKLKTFKLK